MESEKNKPSGTQVTGFIITRNGRTVWTNSRLQRECCVTLDYEPFVDGLVTKDELILLERVKQNQTERFAVFVRSIDWLSAHWDDHKDEFEEQNETYAENSVQYCFLDSSIFEDSRHRFEVIEQICGRLIGRKEPEEPVRDQLLSLLMAKGETTIGELAKNWDASLSHVKKIEAVCHLIKHGAIFLKSTPNTDVENAMVAISAPSDTLPSYVVPFQRFAARLEHHPCYLASKVTDLEVTNEYFRAGTVKLDIVDREDEADATLHDRETNEDYRHIDLRLLSNWNKRGLKEPEENCSDAIFLLWLRTEHPSSHARLQDYREEILRLSRLEKPTPEEVKKSAFKLGVHPQTVRKALRAFEEAGLRGLAGSTHRRGPKGLSRYSKEQIRIVDEAIDEVHASKKRGTVKTAADLVEARCGSGGPSYYFVRRRIKSRSAAEVVEARFGHRVRSEKYGQRGMGNFPDKLYPLHTLEVDHQTVPVMVVDDDGNLLGRPYLSAAIDVFSRTIWGFLLSLSPPTDDSDLLLIRFGAMRKEHVSKKWSLNCEWPIFGLPRQLFTDNGKDLRAALVDEACQTYGIEVLRGPVRKPWFRGHIEAWFRTIKIQLFDNLPGKTFRNSTIERKAGYNPRKEACLTMDELELEIGKWITEQYHNTSHRGLKGKTPLQVWNEGIKDGAYEPVEPANVQRFKDDFLGYAEPDGTRTLARDGVYYKNVCYYHTDLDSLPRTNPDGTPKKYICKIDPSRGSTLYILNPITKQLIPALARDAPDEFTIYELEAANRELGSNKKKTNRLIFQAILDRRERLRQASRRVQRSRRELAAQTRKIQAEERVMGTKAAEKKPKYPQTEVKERKDLAEEMESTVPDSEDPEEGEKGA